MFLRILYGASMTTNQALKLFATKPEKQKAYDKAKEAMSQANADFELVQNMTEIYKGKVIGVCEDNGVLYITCPSNQRAFNMRQDTYPTRWQIYRQRNHKSATREVLFDTTKAEALEIGKAWVAFGILL